MALSQTVGPFFAPSGPGQANPITHRRSHAGAFERGHDTMPTIPSFSLIRFAFLPLLLAFALCPRAAAAEPGENGAPPMPYNQAIREAEQELERQEKVESETKEGWGLSEVLSITALLAALGLMFAASRWSRRLFFRQPRGREMRLLDRMAIGRHSSLLLVSVRDRVYWLAESPGGVSVLAEWPADGDREGEETEPAPVTP